MKREGRGGMCVRTMAVGLLVLVIGGPVSAFVSSQSEDGAHRVDVNGSLRLNGGVLRYNGDLFGNQNAGMSLSLIRLLIRGTVIDNLDFELNGFADVASLPIDLGGSFVSAGNTQSAYRSVWLGRRYSSNRDSVAGGWGWDRLFLRYNWENVSFTAGRFPINHSVAGIFAVNDFFAPFSASAINTVYKPGVDGLRLSIATGMLSTVELIVLPGRPNPGRYDASGGESAPTWEDSAATVRLQTVLRNVNLALLGGRLAGRWMAGGSMQGEVGPVSLYGEGHLTVADPQEDLLLKSDPGRDSVMANGVVGVNVVSPWKNATIGGEYVFFSGGADSSNYGARLRWIDRYPDSLPYLGRHYGAMNVALEVHPLIRAGALALVNLTDGSGMASASLSYNMGNDAEAILGGLLPWGQSASGNLFGVHGEFDFGTEFGNTPLCVFTELRYYF